MHNKLAHFIAAAYRLGLVYTGLATVEHVYTTLLSFDPEDDEALLLELLEGARDVWRTIRRSRRIP